jgi:transcriptional regulator with XRE-family HTH domain
MLNEALRLIRVFHDMKQAEAARKLGISNSYLSEIEKGRKEPTLEVLRKYESVFAIPLSSIMFFAENVDKPKAFESARTLVASKILRLMGYLAEKAGPVHAD